MYRTPGTLPPQFSYLPFLEAAPYAVLLLAGPKHTVLFANAFGKQILDAPALAHHDLFGHLPHLLHTDFSRRVNDVFVQGKPVFDSSLRLASDEHAMPLRAGGSFDVSLIPWKEDDGPTTGVLVLGIDRQGNTAATRRAEQSEKKLQALIDSLPHAVFVSDANGRILYANRLWQRYCGTTAEQMDLEKWYQIVHPDDAVRMDAQWQKRFEHNRFEVSARLRNQETGQYQWQQIVGYPTERDPQHTANWIGTWTDLTHRVQAENHQNDLRQRFVSTLSHDLRGPLTAIRTSAESMLRHRDEAKMPPRLERIIRTVDRTNEMLENLLDINLLHHDGLPHFDLSWTDLIAAMQLSIANFHATFDGRLHTEMPDSVMGFWHAPTLVRAIDNMIGNAFKYGAIDTPVTVRIRTLANEVEVQVHNQGRVLSQAQQERIFTPYERLDDDDPTHTTARGWGLGLSFVADAAHAHGGSVTVTSNATQGTIFVMRVSQQNSLRAQGVVSTQPAASSKAPATDAPQPLGRPPVGQR